MRLLYNNVVSLVEGKSARDIGDGMNVEALRRGEGRLGCVFEGMCLDCDLDEQSGCIK